MRNSNQQIEHMKVSECKYDSVVLHIRILFVEMFQVYFNEQSECGKKNEIHLGSNH
jgi:hypothetical protein